jgi:hypothetical protein
VGIGQSEDLLVDEWTIPKWVLRNMDGTAWIGFIWLRGANDVSCEHDIKP